MAILDFQKPEKIIMLESTDFRGQFEFRPLEPGYGITVGNALRRILLNSLEGFAITAIKIEGVDHEFSTIKGVVEDVTEMVLNLKQVRFKRQIEDSETEEVNITVSGQETFTVGDIGKFTSSFQVLNTDHVICHMEKSVKLNIQITIQKGRGYVPAEENDKPNLPVGTLSIDSIFNPVTKATFNVQPVPGAKAPIEILNLNLQTDGSITAKDAVSYSATYLRDHLMYVEAIANPSVLEISDGLSEETMALRKLLSQTIDEMELSVRSYNCLQAAGIKYIHELVSKEENQMLKYKNFGRKSLTELIEKLDSMNLQFGMQVDKIMAEEV